MKYICDIGDSTKTYFNCVILYDTESKSLIRVDKDNKEVLEKYGISSLTLLNIHYNFNDYYRAFLFQLLMAQDDSLIRFDDIIELRSYISLFFRNKDLDGLYRPYYRDKKGDRTFRLYVHFIYKLSSNTWHVRILIVQYIFVAHGSMMAEDSFTRKVHSTKISSEIFSCYYNAMINKDKDTILSILNTLLISPFHLLGFIDIDNANGFEYYSTLYKAEFANAEFEFITD